jgi:hypothetical protein
MLGFCCISIKNDDIMSVNIDLTFFNSFDLRFNSLSKKKYINKRFCSVSNQTALGNRHDVFISPP